MKILENCAERGEVGRISDLVVTESSCGRGTGNKPIVDRQNGVKLQKCYRPGSGGGVLPFSIFYDNLEQGLYRQGGNCCEIHQDPTQNTNRRYVIKGGGIGQEEGS